eukprot:721504-Prorocentrum_minimum.AAC.1
MRGTNVQNASHQRCEHPGFPGGGVGRVRQQGLRLEPRVGVRTPHNSSAPCRGWGNWREGGRKDQGARETTRTSRFWSV